MKRTFAIFVLAAAVLGLQGCATMMRDAPSQQIGAAKTGSVQIVFMRTSMVAGAVGCELFEVVNGELRFIGQLATGTKIAYQTTPGDKVFMAYGTAADFMTARVEGGKTYYAIVRPNWGTGGFYPTPVRRTASAEPDQSSAEFKSWLTGTRLVEPTEATDGWFKENKTRMQDVYKDYWSRFQRKTASEKVERQMNPADGI